MKITRRIYIIAAAFATLLLVMVSAMFTMKLMWIINGMTAIVIWVPAFFLRPKKATETGESAPSTRQ